MTHGSLFSGIGGFELAAEWCGWTNVFSCEIEPFNQRVLKHYWPNSDLHTDVKEFPASDYTGRIDILTGGFPCQPYSTAGKRLGKEDDRHLWPYMLEIIREIAPTYVVGENVRGLVNWSGGLVFEEVCADLEAAGYDVQPFILPAAGVGAPHRRDRVWFVAHREDIRRAQTTSIGREQPEHEPNHRDEIRRTSDADGRGWVTPDTKNCGRRGRRGEECEERREWILSGKCEGREMGCEAQGRSRIGNAPDTKRDGLEHGTERGSVEGSEGKARERVAGHAEAKGEERNAANTNCGRLEGAKKSGRDSIDVKRESGIGNVTNTNCSGVSRQSANSSTSKETRQGRQGIASAGNFGDFGGWANFPTQSPVCGGDDGLPAELDGITFPKWRNGSIKAYGNAIVPQVAYQIFQTIQQMHND